MSSLIDLTGRTFGGLTVIERAASRQAPSGSWATYWRTRCECGAEGEVESQNLRRGYARSCGGAGCRGRWPKPGPADVLAEQHLPGSVGTCAALYRAAVDSDHAALRDLVLGLDDDDDLAGLLLHVLTVGATALVKAEGSRTAAHAVVDSLAALDRREAR